MTGRREVKPKKRTATKKPAVRMLDKDEIERLIREQAYRLFEQRGYVDGADVDDWLEAERIVTKG